MEEGSVQCALQALQAFWAISLSHYSALVWFAECSKGDKQYLDTTFWVMLRVSDYNAVWFF